MHKLRLLVLSTIFLYLFLPGITKAQTLPQPYGQAGNFQLIFSDEFNGTTLDSSKWNKCYYWGVSEGCVINDKEWQWYSPDNIIVGNGILKLQAQEKNYTSPYGKSYNYTSGMIASGRPSANSTSSKFAFTYGFMEIKAKVPKGRGLWPAFWTLRPDHNWPPEIDTFEILGHETNKTYMYFHYKDTNNTNISSGKSYTGPDYSGGFHTFAVDWSPIAIIWYIDGIEQSKFTSSQFIPNISMYLIANLAVGGPESWPGAPDNSTSFPATYEIDYIRVWKKVSSTPSLTPTSIPSQKPGDANGDNKVDGLDYVVWLNHYNQSAMGATNEDFNNSGKVDGLDYVIWLTNYGS